MDFSQLLDDYGIIIFIFAVCIIYIPFMMMYMRKKKKQAEGYLDSHPEAAKVIIKTKMVGITSDSLDVLSVNGNKPFYFYEKSRKGFFLLPGKNIIEVSYSWTRPGVMHKSVTRTISPSKQEVTVETQGKYILSYDRDQEHYTFEESN